MVNAVYLGIKVVQEVLKDGSSDFEMNYIFVWEIFMRIFLPSQILNKICKKKGFLFETTIQG